MISKKIVYLNRGEFYAQSKDKIFDRIINNFNNS